MRRLVAVLAVAAVLAGCGGEQEPQAVGSPSSSAVPGLSPEPSVSGAPLETGSEGGVVLGGEDLGVTRLGVPFRQAVDAVRAVLGEPTADPSEVVRCIESRTEVEWTGFVLAEQDGRLAGWASQSRTLQTPSGVAVGTPVSELERLYGDGLQRFPANPDNPPTFAVEGVDVLGGLSTPDDDAVVTGLSSGFCAGP